MNGEIGDLESEDKEKSFKSRKGTSYVLECTLIFERRKTYEKEQFALSPCWSFKRCR